MIHKFLDLGKQPLTNKFLTKQELNKPEKLYDLNVGFDDESYLVSIINNIKPEEIFHKEYNYSTGMSQTMINHFKEIATSGWFVNGKTLEIGSNDGTFIQNLPKDKGFCLEPCTNFAKATNKMGYKTWPEFLTTDIAKKIVKEVGQFDQIYSANCLCHIQDTKQVLESINILLKDKGYLIFEDPDLLPNIQNNAFHQFYHAHDKIFSSIYLEKIFDNTGFKVIKVDHLNVHGGSCRYYVGKGRGHSNCLMHKTDQELKYGLDKLETYKEFAKRVKNNREVFRHLAMNLDMNYGDGQNKIVGYGATSKAVLALNYYGPDNYIKEFMDTTPDKQGKYIPGIHTPVVPYTKELLSQYKYAYLGAWNYLNEICNKEKEWLDNGGKFICEVPYVRLIS